MLSGVTLYIRNKKRSPKPSVAGTIKKHAITDQGRVQTDYEHCLEEDFR